MVEVGRVVEVAIYACLFLWNNFNDMRTRDATIRVFFFAHINFFMDQTDASQRFYYWNISCSFGGFVAAAEKSVFVCSFVWFLRSNFFAILTLKEDSRVWIPKQLALNKRGKLLIINLRINSQMTFFLFSSFSLARPPDDDELAALFVLRWCDAVVIGGGISGSTISRGAGAFSVSSL